MMHRLFVPLAFVSCTFSAAHAEADPKDCLGPNFDPKTPAVVSRVKATEPRANFVKSGWEDRACPDALTKCATKSFLLPGDLVMTGPVRGAVTCVAYQPPRQTKVRWTIGWLPSVRLKKVEPLPTPKTADWIGHWQHAGGTLDITAVAGGALSITGEAVIPTAHDFHTGVIKAQTFPSGRDIRFAEDGSEPFEKASEGTCRVRLQRIADGLVVEDNDACGGAAVSFDGIYRRGK